MVNTRFWIDGYVEKMTPEGKLLYLYLITNPRVEICGAYEFSTKIASAETGLSEQAIDSLVAGWVQAEKVLLEDGWILILNFLKHQNPNPSILQGVVRSMADIPLSFQQKLQALYSLPPPCMQEGTLKPKLKPKLKLKLRIIKYLIMGCCNSTAIIKEEKKHLNIIMNNCKYLFN